MKLKIFFCVINKIQVFLFDLRSSSGKISQLSFQEPFLLLSGASYVAHRFAIGNTLAIIRAVW